MTVILSASAPYFWFRTCLMSELLAIICSHSTADLIDLSKNFANVDETNESASLSGMRSRTEATHLFVGMYDDYKGVRA